MGSVAFSLFSLKGQFSTGITPRGTCECISSFPQGQKQKGFVREVHRKALEIHFACLQWTSTIQLAYNDSDHMGNAAGCFLGVRMQVFPLPVGKAKRLTGALWLLLLVHTSRASQGLLWGQA